MKIYFRKHIVLILFVLFAGTAFSMRLSNLPVSDNEKVVLFTDRSIYISGELIQFSASISSRDDSSTFIQSQILYCELVTPDGNIIVNNKYPVTNSIAGGCITIPDGLLTGIYYIRAYTKLMRNFGPESYEYKQIKIINPHKGEVLSTEKSQDFSVQQFNQKNENELNNIIIISVDQLAYAPRETISISYSQGINSTMKIKNLCLSVVPENSKSLISLQHVTEKQLNVEMKYYPESKGLSLVGKLTETSSSIPVTDKKINLSIVGEGRDFMVARTDSDGRFFFALPGYNGTRDLFLCAEKMSSKEVKIWVDNDFCTTPFRLPAPEFALSDQERLTVQNMAQNKQIHSHFQGIKVMDSLTLKKEMNAFYGIPTTILYIDKYIQLPTLEEYFNELPSMVKVRKRKGDSYFAVQSSTEISIYDPLVLIDWVAVDEPSKILAVSPQNIASIEVVNEDYVKGGETYGGIISILSKKGDFAGVDLPSTGIFINYRFLAKNECEEKPGYSPGNQPDVRNTLFWEPNIKVPVSAYDKITFTAPDTPGKYNVVFEGVTTEGEIFSVSKIFEVTN